MAQIAAYFSDKGARDLPVFPSAQALPTPLVIDQGVYNIGGQSYDCRDVQGLIKVVMTPYGTVNRIVFRNDYYSLMSGLCWILTHGDEEEPVAGETLGSWITRMGSSAKVQKLRMRCSHAVNLAKHFMSYYGAQSRTVRWLTMEDPTGQPWQGVDEGHVAMESQIGGQWRYFDPDCGWYLTDTLGAHAEARTLPSLVSSGQYITQRLAVDPPYAAEPYEVGEFDLGGYLEITLLRDDGKGDGTDRWVKRVMQAVGWDHVGLNEVWWVLPPGSEHRASWVLSLQPNYRIKTAAEIATTFYP